MTTTISTRIDSDKKKQAEELFSEFGLTLSSAINLFLSQAIVYQGIPFPIRRMDSKKRDMLDAMNEARALSKDPDAIRYGSVDALMKDLLA